MSQICQCQIQFDISFEHFVCIGTRATWSVIGTVYVVWQFYSFDFNFFL